MNEQTRALVRELARVCWEGGSIDGGDLQEMLVKHGILIPTVVDAPCNDANCFCAVEYGEEMFPLTCYKLAPDYL